MSNTNLIKINNSPPAGRLSLLKLAKLRMLEPIPMEEREASERKATRIEDGSMPFYSSEVCEPHMLQLMKMESCQKPIFNHFPCLLQSDGSPWALGNIYLLELAKSSEPAEPATLEKIAKALQDFFSVMEELNLNFLDFPSREARRPTYAYSYHYKDIAKESSSTISESNKKILKIVAFYRWMTFSRGLEPQHPMWTESVEYIRMKSRIGTYFEKAITRTDLTIRAIKTLGNKALRSYDEDEQKALIESLIQIDNTEMTLGFLLALTTGARLQTVFTLQANSLDDYDGSDYYPVVVGHQGFADSKFQKRFAIFIPGWLVRLLQTYIASQRYAARKAKSLYGHSTGTYIFLAKTGTPYYALKNDPHAAEYRTQRIGKSVQAFISQQLAPNLIASGHNFKVRFHNLRATFGDNVVVDNLDRLNAGEITWLELLTLVSEKLAHSSTEETENYINSVRKKKLKAIAQGKLESYLESRMAEMNGYQNG